jgi:hypothetical protein
MEECNMVAQELFLLCLPSLCFGKKVGAIAIVNEVARRTRSAHHGCYCASGGVCEVNSEERRV